MRAVLSAHCLDPAPLPDRPAAARAGGFDRIGLSLNHIRRWCADGGTLEELDRALLRHRVSVGELEVVELGGDGTAEREAAELAARYDVGHLQVVAPSTGSVAALATAFGELCDRSSGMSVGLEPLPWTAVPDLRTTAEVVETAGRPNGGACIDVWHHFRHGGDLLGVEPCRGNTVAVQLSDGFANPDVADPFSDCLDSRMLPGTGTFPLADVLDLAGPDVHLAVEVLSTELRAMAPAAAARRIGESTGRLLDNASHDADVAGICAALAACARLADEHRPDELAEHFTADCAVTFSSRQTLHGREEFREYLRDALARYTATSHLLGLPEIRFLGPDQAGSVVTVQAWHRSFDGATDITLHGRYLDRWERTATGWLIAQRKLEIAGTVGRSMDGFHRIGEPP